MRGLVLSTVLAAALSSALVSPPPGARAQEPGGGPPGGAGPPPAQGPGRPVIEAGKCPDVCVEDWNFTPAEYQALLARGVDLTFAPDSAWFPAKYQANLLATLRWALSADRKPSVTDGINKSDLYHGHIVCPRPCDCVTPANPDRVPTPEDIASLERQVASEELAAEIHRKTARDARQAAATARADAARATRPRDKESYEGNARLADAQARDADAEADRLEKSAKEKAEQARHDRTRAANKAYDDADKGRDPKFGFLTAQSLPDFAAALKKEEDAGGKLLTALCTCESERCSVIYHTYEGHFPADNPSMKPTDPRRNVKTDFSDNTPRAYTPPRSSDVNSYSDTYCTVLQFSFLVDRDGKIHVTLNSTHELSKVTGTPMN